MGQPREAGSVRRTARALLSAMVVASGVAGAITWYGCSIYDSSLLLPAADSGPRPDAFATEAGPDAQDAGPDAAPVSCPETFPPSGPTADDPSDAGDQAFVTAVRTIEILDDGGQPPPLLGYDLDKVYSCCDASPGSCSPGVTGSMHFCDEPGGRDNNSSALLAVLASLDSTQFNTSSISQRLEQGTYSILLQVLHYNGQPNDAHVTAALYAADGVEGDAGARWDGTDLWTVDQGFVVDPDASTILPTHFDGNAFVSNGTLVVHVDFPISLGVSSTGSFAISLTAGIITGTVVPTSSGTYRVENGQIAGRWNVSDLLNTVQSLNYQGSPLCRGSTAYQGLVKPYICQYVDIMTDPMQDKMGKTCDALSLGFGFTAEPALMGYTVAPPIRASLCGDAGATPDDCTH